METVENFIKKKYGISDYITAIICKDVGILKKTPFSFLTESQKKILNNRIENGVGNLFILNKKNILKKFIPKSTRFDRLKRGLPVNGQRSKGNAKTARKTNKKIFRQIW